jgi:hypothetical protein
MAVVVHAADDASHRPLCLRRLDTSMGVTSSPPLQDGKGPTTRYVYLASEANGPSEESLVSSSPFPSAELHALVAPMTGGEVSDVSVHDRWQEICTIRRDCKGMVVVFLLPFWRFEVSGSSGNGYRRISASVVSNQLSLLTVMFPSLFEMEIGNSFSCGCGRVVVALIIWRSPRIGGYFDVLEEEFRVGCTQKTALEELMKSCILEIFLFFFFISYVLVGHRCALVHF